MECQIKVDKVLAGPEAADFLRRLADGLEKDKLIVGDTTVEMRRSIQIEESLDVKGDQVTYGLKVTHQSNAGPAPEEAPDRKRDVKPPVKKLKKRMAKSFKAVLDVLQEGELPRLDQVGSFCADTDIMFSVMDKAQENFPAFKAKCRDLLVAVEHGNLENAIDAAGDINQLRKDCHASYKQG